MTLKFIRNIGYTKSWKSTFYIGLIMASAFSFILIFLQPFDTYSVEMTYKNLKLGGYSIPIIFSLLVIHWFENKWYQKTYKWSLLNELLVMFFGTTLMTVLSFIYLNHVVNPTALPWSDFFPWLKVFGLPFIPIFLAFWIYLRFSFSKIELTKTSNQENPTIKILGDNANEVIEMKWSQFLMANSQSNYIEVFYLDTDTNTTNKNIIRGTLSKLMGQLPEATQVHRSFIINLDQITKLEGNMRKGWCYINSIDDKIPVSPKHFKALKEVLQNHP